MSCQIFQAVRPEKTQRNMPRWICYECRHILFNTYLGGSTDPRRRRDKKADAVSLAGKRRGHDLADGLAYFHIWIPHLVVSIAISVWRESIGFVRLVPEREWLED